MNKNVIFIGIGVVALGGLAYWYLTKAGSQSTSGDASMQKSANPTTDDANIPNVPTDTVTEISGKSRKQVRRDCRAEAKAQGLKGREKRQFKKQCKAEGGINADTADFAFNGFDGAFEFA